MPIISGLILTLALCTYNARTVFQGGRFPLPEAVPQQAIPSPMSLRALDSGGVEKSSLASKNALVLRA